MRSVVMRFVIFLLVLSSGMAHAKVDTYVNPLGLKDNSPEGMSAIPTAVPTFAATTGGIPSKYDLSPLFPPVGYQGMQSSCVAWSVGYAVKSYQEKVEHGWSYNDATLFSPAFIYNQINNGKDRGSVISHAMDLIVNQGAATLKTMPYKVKDYWSQPSQAAKAEAKKYLGLKYARIDYNDIRTVKSYISQGVPVVFGVSIDDSFYKLNRDNYVYHTMGGRSYGGHAMALVGYDDNKFGGAFKLINSWGTQWGNKGFAWIPYDNWIKMKPWALVMYDIQKNTTINKPAPGIPSGLMIGVGTYGKKDMLSVYWTKSDYADTYYVYRWAEGESSTWELQKIVSETQYYDLDVKQGVQYSYYVQAANQSKKSKPSVVVKGQLKGKKKQVVVKKTKPLPPDTISVGSRKHSDKMAVKWSAVKGADHYVVYFWKDGMEDWKYVSKSESTSITHDSLKPSTEYFYIVYSHNAQGYSQPSDIASGTTRETIVVKKKPARVDNLTASQGDYPGKILLSWNSAQYAEAYDLYRWSQSRDKWMKLTSTSDTVFKDLKVEPHYRYFYTIVAKNKYGKSAGVNPIVGFAYAELRPRLSMSKSYSELDASQGKFTSFVLLKFDKIPLEEKYTVYRRSQKNPRWKILTEVGVAQKKKMNKFLAGTVNTKKSEYYIDRDVEKEIVYMYKIAPVDLKGTDIVSKLAAGWKKGHIYVDPPADARDLKITRSTDKAVMSWKPADNAQGYYIYQYDKSQRKFVQVDYTIRTVTIMKQKGAEKERWAVAAYNWAGISKKIEEVK